MMLASRLAARISWRPRPRGVSSASCRGDSLGLSTVEARVAVDETSPALPALWKGEGPLAERDEPVTSL